MLATSGAGDAASMRSVCNEEHSGTQGMCAFRHIAPPTKIAQQGPMAAASISTTHASMREAQALVASTMKASAAPMRIAVVSMRSATLTLTPVRCNVAVRHLLPLRRRWQVRHRQRARWYRCECKSKRIAVPGTRSDVCVARVLFGLIHGGFSSLWILTLGQKATQH